MLYCVSVCVCLVRLEMIVREGEGDLNVVATWQSQRSFTSVERQTRIFNSATLSTPPFGK